MLLLFPIRHYHSTNAPYSSFILLCLKVHILCNWQRPATAHLAACTVTVQWVASQFHIGRSFIQIRTQDRAASLTQCLDFLSPSSYVSGRTSNAATTASLYTPFNTATATSLYTPFNTATTTSLYTPINTATTTSLYTPFNTFFHHPTIRRSMFRTTDSIVT